MPRFGGFRFGALLCVAAVMLGSLLGAGFLRLPLVPTGSADAAEIPLLLPMRGNVEVYGNLPDKGDHKGLDYYAVDLRSDDTRIFPTAPGKIVFAGWNCQTRGTDCYGNVVAMDHGNGLYSIYTHLADGSYPAVTAADAIFVNYTTVIGTMSDTGCTGCGAHLHFAVRRGPAGLTGTRALFGSSLQSENVWGVIPDLPDPAAHTTIDRTASTTPPGGVWIFPDDDKQVVTGRTLTLKARAYPTNGSDPAIAYVNFTIAWPGVGGSWRLACPSVVVSDTDRVECTADLQTLGAPAGELTVSFDVYDRSGTSRLAPHGTHKIKWDPADVLGVAIAAPNPGPIPPISDTVVAVHVGDPPSSDSVPMLSPAGTAVPSSEEAIAAGASVVVTGVDVPLRTAPSASAEPVATLARGTQLTVIAASQSAGAGNWWPVQDPATGAIGFVSEEFLSTDLAAVPPVATPAVPSLSEDELEQRIADAIQQAGTYRYETYYLPERRLGVVVEVDLARGFKLSYPEIGGTTYCAERTAYYGSSGGDWSVGDWGGPCSDVLTNQLWAYWDSSLAWTLSDFSSTDGGRIYVLEWVFDEPTLDEELRPAATLRIDAATFLPEKLYQKALSHGGITEAETVFSGWGEPVDMAIPAEALAVAQATATAVARAQALPATVAQIAPQALLALLVSSPISDSGLPLGFFSFSASEVEGGPLGEEISGNIGSVDMTAPGGEHGISYVVFPNVEDARLGTDALEAVFQRQAGAFVSYPGGFDYPVTLLSGYVEGTSFGVCVVQIGNVLVVGGSTLSGGSQSQVETNAIDLARSGIGHLAQLMPSGSTGEPQSFFVDLGDFGSEAAVALAGWSRDGEIDPAPSGDTSVRYVGNAAESYPEDPADSFLVFTQLVPNQSYLLTIEFMTHCELELSANGLWLETLEPPVSTNRNEVQVHELEIPADAVTSPVLLIAFAPAYYPVDCVAGVYNVRVDPTLDASQVGQSEPSAASPAADIVIELVEFAFEPQDISIPAGTDVEVTLTNSGTVLHDFTVDELDIHEDVDAGASSTITINAEAGTYEVVCTEPGHEQSGMTGTLIVE